MPTPYRNLSQVTVFHLQTELMMKVFTLICDSHWKDLSRTESIWEEIGLNKPPINLFNTCRHWRDITTSMPDLWSRISVNLGKNQPQDFVDSATIKMFLRYSGTAPLWLRVTADEYYEYEDSVLLSRSLSSDKLKILQLLVNESYRWHNVFFRLSWRVFTSMTYLMSHPISDNPTKVYANLEFLQLGWSTHDEILCSNLFFDSFAFAPNLRTIKLHEFNQHFKLPYQQIKSLSISSWTDCTAEELEKILASFPGLEHITFRPSSSVSSPLLRASTSPSLKSIYIKFAYYWDQDFTASIPQIFSVLSNNISSLKSLHLDIAPFQSAERQYDFTNDLISFIQRPCCQSLESLHLDSVIMHDDALLQFLSLIPTLTHLSLSNQTKNVVVTNQFFQDLTISEGHQTPILLPCLENLEIMLGQTYMPPEERDSYDPGIILSMVQSRCAQYDSASCVKLEKFTLQTETIYTKLAHDWVDVFRSKKCFWGLARNGLELKLELRDYYLEDLEQRCQQYEYEYEYGDEYGYEDKDGYVLDYVEKYD